MAPPSSKACAFAIGLTSILHRRGGSSTVDDVQLNAPDARSQTSAQPKKAPQTEGAGASFLQGPIRPDHARAPRWPKLDSNESGGSFFRPHAGGAPVLWGQAIAIKVNDVARLRSKAVYSLRPAFLCHNYRLSKKLHSLLSSIRRTIQTRGHSCTDPRPRRRLGAADFVGSLLHADAHPPG